MLSRESLFQKACRFATLVDLALTRQDAPGREMTVWNRGADGATTRSKIACDFSKAATLQILDEQMLPVIRSVIDEAARRDMTAVRAVFSEQALYALETVGSVGRHDYREITEMLYPRQRPETGIVIQFPGRALAS